MAFSMGSSAFPSACSDAASEAFRTAIGTYYRIPRQLIQNRYEPIEAP
jgi:hypothetical protein